MVRDLGLADAANALYDNCVNGKTLQSAEFEELMTLSTANGGLGLRPMEKVVLKTEITARMNTRVMDEPSRDCSTPTPREFSSQVNVSDTSGWEVSTAELTQSASIASTISTATTEMDSLQESVRSELELSSASSASTIVRPSTPSRTAFENMSDQTFQNLYRQRFRHRHTYCIYEVWKKDGRPRDPRG